MNGDELAKALCAFSECHPDLQKCAIEMARIMCDADVDDQEKDAAESTIQEILFPKPLRDSRVVFRRAYEAWLAEWRR